MSLEHDILFENKQIKVASLTEFEAKASLSEGSRRRKMDQKVRYHSDEIGVQT